MRRCRASAFICATKRMSGVAVRRREASRRHARRVWRRDVVALHQRRIKQIAHRKAIARLQSERVRPLRKILRGHCHNLTDVAVPNVEPIKDNSSGRDFCEAANLQFFVGI